MSATAAAVTKNAAASSAPGLAAALFIPEDWPLLLAILLGLVVGTFASWVWSDQSGVPMHRRWLLWQLGTWGLIYVLVLYAQESVELSTRASMAMAAIFSWLGRDGLQRLRFRYLDAIMTKGKTHEQEVRLPGTDSAGPGPGPGGSG